MDWTPRTVEMTTPDLHDDAVALVKVARALSVGDLQSLMHLSEKLAQLNRDRFASFEENPTPDTVRPAAFALPATPTKGLRRQIWTTMK